MSSENSIKTLAKIAIMAAVAVVIMLVSFPLPSIAPSFYKLDFSEVAVLIGSFALGPLAGIAIEALKVLLNLVFNGTNTAFIGEFANFLMGCALVVPAGFIYQKNRTRKGAVISIVVGIISMVIAGDLLNYFLLIPAYVSIAHFPLEAIIAAGTKIFPFINSTLSLVLVCVTLFNLVKGILVGIITALVYKRVSPLLKK
ncbi:MAG: ECF transporter S component [Erysipelotrichaceae bacterium]|nr:ECF transporter S component [Erysipelotrichaceae bacterium]